MSRPHGPSFSSLSTLSIQQQVLQPPQERSTAAQTSSPSLTPIHTSSHAILRADYVLRSTRSLFSTYCGPLTLPHLPPFEMRTLYLLRLFGETVMPDCLAQSLWFTLIAVGFTVLCDVGEYNLEVSTIMLSILSTMLSSVISLRTSSALDRWNSGRLAWTHMSTASRNLASFVWIHVGQTTLSQQEEARLVKGSPEEEMEKVKGLIKKRTILNLIQAYSAATKHYVREESGINWDDLYPLVQALPKYSFPDGIDNGNSIHHDQLTGLWRSPLPDGSTVIPVASSSAHSHSERSQNISFGTMHSSATLAKFELDHGQSVDDLGTLGKEDKRRKIRLAPGYNPPKKNLYTYMPVLKLFEPAFSSFFNFVALQARYHPPPDPLTLPYLAALIKIFHPDRRRKRKIVAATNVPLEIHLFLSGYVAACCRRGSIGIPHVSVVFGYLDQLAQALAEQERVLSSPLPFAYDVHLRAVTYAFLIFLPFQIYSDLDYLTILAEFVTSVVFLGFIELGNQLQNPFGYDHSDLDLDRFVALLASELQEIAAHPAPDPSSFVWTPSNVPFQPLDTRSALDVLTEYTDDHPKVDDAAAARGVPKFRRFLQKQHHEQEQRGRKAYEADKKAHRRLGSTMWGGGGRNPHEVEVVVL